MKPNQSAGDHSIVALEAAAANWALLQDRWHDPKTCNANTDDYDGSFVAYYRDPESGSHGWMCTKCCAIVQTG